MGMDIHTKLEYRGEKGNFHNIVNYRFIDGQYDETPMKYFRNSFFFNWLNGDFSDEFLSKELFMTNTPGGKKWEEEHRKYCWGFAMVTLKDIDDAIAKLDAKILELKNERDSKRGHGCRDEIAAICRDHGVLNCDLVNAIAERFGTLDEEDELEYNGSIEEYAEYRDMLMFWRDGIYSYATTWFDGDENVWIETFDPSRVNVLFCFDN